MAEYTESFKLKKPAKEDFYNVEDFNGNMDIVERVLKEQESEIALRLKEKDYTRDKIVEKINVLGAENGGTGESSLDNFFKKRVFVNADIDVDTLVTSGTYQIAGALNMPTNNYGILHVEKFNSYIVQVYYCINSQGKFSIWERTSSNSSTSWSSWHEIYTSNNAASLIQGLLKGGEISVVKSVQHFNGTFDTNGGTSKSITISSVNRAKSFISFRGTGSSDFVGSTPIAYFASDTSVTVIRSSSAYSALYAFDVIEYY